jgi:hypothetical protein
MTSTPADDALFTDGFLSLFTDGDGMSIGCGRTRTGGGTISTPADDALLTDSSSSFRAAVANSEARNMLDGNEYCGGWGPGAARGGGGGIALSSMLIGVNPLGANRTPAPPPLRNVSVVDVLIDDGLGDGGGIL